MSSDVYDEGGKSATEEDDMSEENLVPIEDATVPVSVLADGECRARAVAYLREQGYSYEDIVGEFGISITTARQYVSDVKKGRR